MFLGSTRLSQVCLNTFLESEEYGRAFEIVALVSNLEFASIATKSFGSNFRPKVIDCASRNESTIAEALRNLDVTLIFSAQHPWVLSKFLLSLVGGRAINLHNAQLPNYKGHNTIAHELMNGESWHEATLHWMAEGVDEGPTVYSNRIEIEKQDTALTVYGKSLTIVPILVEQLIVAITKGKIPIGKMPDGQHAYYSKNSLDAIQEITPDVSGDYLGRVSRALFFPPFEPAFFLVGENKVFVIPALEYKTYFSNFPRENYPS
jgi:methionyl-tRNA formyltransferase